AFFPFSNRDKFNGRYDASKFLSSFVGIVPADEPRFVVAVMIDEPQGIHYGGYMPHVSLDWHAQGGDSTQCGNPGSQVVPAYKSNGLGDIDLEKLTYSVPAVLQDDARPGGCELKISLVNQAVPRQSPLPAPVPAPGPVPIPDPYSGPSLMVRFESVSGNACDGTTPAGGSELRHGGSLTIGTHFSDATEACKLTLRFLD
ncbi:MAG: penicillin-binding transpeptidase domain-containing protein, partial [Gammaproteobacteria bacterium]